MNVLLSPYPASHVRPNWSLWGFGYPHRIMDQHFGLPLLDSDLLEPMDWGRYTIRPRTDENISASGSSELICDEDEFLFILNLQPFMPEEINVKIVNNYIVIHGQHGEREDEHGYVSREFTRRYLLPGGIELETMTCALSASGLLTIKIPKKQLGNQSLKKERVVPVTFQDSTAT